MLVGIGFLILILAVAVLIAVDVLRTPSEAPAGQADRHGHDPERAVAGARGGAGVHAFPREPAAREKPAPPAAARFAAGPVEADSASRPDEAARAFDQMRREMSQSAASEAALRGKSNAMFVNLSRRSQALVERQLRLIESLEHGEQDQQRLASLSRLNRIAMRMHRNSQNLLVLAGQEPATGWNQPVTLARLVEAALSEVEDYERVSFEVQPDIAVRGPAVHDAVHLLVELIDNATSFSAADMPVHIRGHVLTTGGALVDVTDRGIGMAAHELAYANQQLDNPPPPDIDVPRWMGLLVVARLATRHGIRVRLNQADLGGLTALVWLPDEILTHYSAAADPGHPAAAPRAATASSPAVVPARMDQPAAQPGPAWSARGPRATVQAEPATARLSGAGRPDAPGGDLGVVVPQAESQATMRRLPIFDDVESRWSRSTREASAPVSLAAPAAAGPPTGGLPRRPPAGTQASRTVSGLPPGAPTGFQRGAGQGRTATPEDGNPGGPDES
jgi:signal transduction histidine kinase